MKIKKGAPESAPFASLKIQSKDKHLANQMQRVFEEFYIRPSTLLMVSRKTGILRANICRYIAEMERIGNIHKIGYGICPISKHRAGFYTTRFDKYSPYKLLCYGN